MQTQAASQRSWKVFPYTFAQAIPLPPGKHAFRPFQTQPTGRKIRLQTELALNGFLGGTDAASAT